MSTTPEKNLNATPKLDTLQQAAENLLRERVLSKGGRQPSETTVKAAARVMAGRAMREVQAKTPAQQAVEIAAKLMAAKRAKKATSPES